MPALPRDLARFCPLEGRRAQLLRTRLHGLMPPRKADAVTYADGTLDCHMSACMGAISIGDGLWFDTVGWLAKMVRGFAADGGFLNDPTAASNS